MVTKKPVKFRNRDGRDENKFFFFPAIYKYYGGDMCATIAYSSPVSEEYIASLPIESHVICANLASGETLNICETDDGYKHSISDCNADLAVYRDLLDNDGVYAEPISVFMANTVDEKDYRFTLLTY